MQLTFDGSIMQKLLGRAASAARRVSCLDPGDAVVELLADDIDAIVHELSELLGDPRGLALPGAPDVEPAPVSFNAGGDR